MQCVHNNPMKTTPKLPTARPAVLIALGTAKIPVPKEHFNRWMSAPENLLKNNDNKFLFVWAINRILALRDLWRKYKIDYNMKMFDH